MHDCLNLVTEPPGLPAALLIRAVEPVAGIDTMRAARERRMRARTKDRHASVAPRPSPVPAHRLAAGPGLVCAAFDLDRTLTGADLLDREAAVHVEPPPEDEAAPTVVRGPRIGVAYAGERWATVPWRFAIAANPAVSRPAIAR
jgi:DNA-3-methyladenine glycosylase